MPRFNDVRRFSKSIIEEWKNPQQFDENVIRSDQLYEERAIDVATDTFRQARSHGKSGTGDVRDAEKSTAKSKSNNNNNSATVRSIPIKNYQASIAYNIGTLRRSEAPQLQFESSMSEGEKNPAATKHEAVPSSKNEIVPQFRRSARSSKLSKTLAPSRRSCHSCDFAREIQNGSRKVSSRLTTLDRRIARSEHDIVKREDEDFTDLGDYFHESPSQQFRSSNREKSKTEKVGQPSRQERAKNGDKKGFDDDASRGLRKWGTVDLKRGHVGQKISAFEEHVKRSSRNSNSAQKYQCFPEMNKHRAIGVPLVGMHNACGLPVVASWHDHELLEPVRIRGRVVGTLRPIFKGTRNGTSSDLRHQAKRKTLPSQNNSRRSRTCRESNTGLEYPSVKSLLSSEVGNCDFRRRVRRHRPSFKAKNTATFSSKNSARRRSRSIRKRSKENSEVDGPHRKSIEAGNAKRQTLYARDEGEDAVEVLKNLCLNPLARTKSETDMIW